MTRPRAPSPCSSGRALRRGIALASATWALAAVAQAAVIDIRPIVFQSDAVSSVIATGTLTTAGATATLTDWNLQVTSSTLLGRYTPANTRNLSLGVVSDGAQLSVPTSPDGVTDGGSLMFMSPNPFADFSVAVADFGFTFVPAGGQAFFIAGGAFDVLPLGQSDGASYVAALARVPGGNVFDLTPLTFGGGVTLSGTVTTNGHLGTLAAADIVSWDIVVEQVTVDVFDATNSVLLADLLALSPDGRDLTVANPDGFLAFSRGLVGGRPYLLQLADFSPQSPPGGQAGYFQGRLSSMTLDLNAARGPWAVTGTEPVRMPEPASVALVLLALATAAGAGRALGDDRRR